MKRKYAYWLIYFLFSSIVLFVFCALPWYAVLSLSSWYMILAFPLTFLSGVTCGEALNILKEELEYDGDEFILLDDFFEF